MAASPTPSAASRTRSGSGGAIGSVGRRRGSLTCCERTRIEAHRPGGRLAASHVRANQLEHVAARLTAKRGHRTVVHGAGVGDDGPRRIGRRREVEDGARGVEAVGGDRRRPRQAPGRAVAREGLGGDEVDAPADVEGEVAAHERPRLVDGDAHRLVVAARRVREERATVLGGDGARRPPGWPTGRRGPRRWT